MWERKLKNQFGDIEHIYRSEPDEQKPYDAVDGFNYHVEYLRNDMVEHAENAEKKGSEIEPWMLNDEYDTNSPGRAVAEYLLRYFDPDVSETFMWIETPDNEINLEFPPIYFNAIRECIQAGIQRQIGNYSDRIDALQKELNAYKGFLDSVPGAVKMFKEWKEKQNENQ